jgi:hypothetical protein
MNIDTRTIPNFLSDSEIEFIENYVMSNFKPWENWNQSQNGQNVMSGHYYCFDYYDKNNDCVYDILQSKFTKEFGPDLNIQQIHIFDAFDPYSVHSDVDSGGAVVAKAPVPAWTFIIPLFDVNSHTIVFNEQSQIKDPEVYFKENPRSDTLLISTHDYNKYFSHIPLSYFYWLTIEDIFQWKKGSLFAASRYKFHTSDNFIANNIKNKRALIAWTSLPEN